MDIYNPNITGSLTLSGSMYIDGTFDAPNIVGMISESSQIDYTQIQNPPQGDLLTNTSDLQISSSNYPVSGTLSVSVSDSVEVLNLDGYKIYANEFTHSLAPSPSIITLYSLPDNSAGNLRVKTIYSGSSFYDYAWVFSSGSKVFYPRNEITDITSSVSLTMDTDTGQILSANASNNKIVLQSIIDVMSGSISVEGDEESGLVVEYLVVGGGGGGGDWVASGGGGGGGVRGSFDATGGGGFIEVPLILSTSTNYTVTVGEGGSGGVYTTSRISYATNGFNSIFHTITSIGGGSGGEQLQAPGIGGSGGGGRGYTTGDYTIAQITELGAIGTANQGYNGGVGRYFYNGSTLIYDDGGGGGGAGEPGQSYNSTNISKGGDGIESSITGIAAYYGGGGAGGSYNNGSNTGGLGGGGNGGNRTIDAQNGTANTGGGGGGCSNERTSGNGGSGVVILRYPNNYSIITTSGDLVLETSFVGTDTVTKFTEGSGEIQFVEGSLVIQYLVVGGGGGAGGTETTFGGGAWYGGGGGAGGLLTGNITTIQSGVNYNLSVGLGGTGGVSSSSPTPGQNGQNSVFDTFTAIGGGGGGGGYNSSNKNGSSGGSGGGGGSDYNTSNPIAGSGTVGQGNNGGNGSGATLGHAGSGGGAGGTGNDAAAVCPGGVGLTLDITGVNVTYSTGGDGGNNSVLGSNGAANTGDGGDRGNAPDSGNGHSGGSGVVILRYPSTYTITNPGGGLTFTTTTVGSDKVTTFTEGSGEIQFEKV